MGLHISSADFLAISNIEILPIRSRVHILARDINLYKQRQASHLRCKFVSLVSDQNWRVSRHLLRALHSFCL